MIEDKKEKKRKKKHTHAQHSASCDKNNINYALLALHISYAKRHVLIFFVHKHEGNKKFAS